MLYGGYDSAPSLIGMVEASSNPAPKVAVYKAAVTEPLMWAGVGHDHGHSEETHADEHGHGEEGDADEHDHSSEEMHADEHGHGEKEHVADHGDQEKALIADPHILHSAVNNGAIANVIANQLANVNPEQAAFYQDNAAALAAQFVELDTWIQTQVETIPVSDRKLVPTHDAFRYFADAYTLEVKGALSVLSTEEQPSAADLISLVDQVKDAKVPAIFAESSINPDLIKTVASNAGVEVAQQPLLVEGPSNNDETMQTMLVLNTCTIVNALGGTCDDESAPI